MRTTSFLSSTMRQVLSAGVATAILLAAPAPAHAQLVQWSIASGGNGHWYEYVSAPSIFAPVSFDAARAAAEASTHLGLQGYLATVTSAAEQQFINGAFSYLFGFGATSTAWLGASDAAVEGEWRWLGGPEVGQLVSYSDWLPGHPISGPGFESYDYLALLVNAQSVPVSFGWSSSPSNGALGYIVEYGAGVAVPVPEPSTTAITLLGLTGIAIFGRGRRRTA
jgi:hypothetical protein